MYFHSGFSLILILRISCAIELEDGTIIQGRQTETLSSASAVILNALKYLAGLNENKHLILPEVLIPLQELKTKQLKTDVRLNIDETLKKVRDIINEHGMSSDNATNDIDLIRDESINKI